MFLERLTPAGVLTFSRFYPDGVPGEMYRMTSLAVRALAESGAESPEDHIVVARHVWPYSQGRPSGIGTILVGKSPLTDASGTNSSPSGRHRIRPPRRIGNTTILKSGRSNLRSAPARNPYPEDRAAAAWTKPCEGHDSVLKSGLLLNSFAARSH